MVKGNNFGNVTSDILAKGKEKMKNVPLISSDLSIFLAHYLRKMCVSEC